MLSPLLIALALGLVSAATIPTYRLYAAGWGPGRLVGYLTALVALGFAVALGIGPLRVTVPVLVLLVAAPYLLAAFRSRVGRALGSARWWRPPSARRPPPRIVGDGPGRTVTRDEPSADTDRPRGTGTG